MKSVSVWMLMVVLTVVSLSAQEQKKYTDEELGEMYAQAVVLHRFGRYDEAEAVARKIEAQVPNNADVKRLLAEIANARAVKLPARGTEIQKRLSEAKLPEIKLREAPARDAVELVREEAAKALKDSKPVNLVWLVPADAKIGTVTLSLTDISALDALNYIMQITKLKYRFDPNAIVVFQPEPAKPTANAPAAE
jgi:hypothetical protein